jgi:hypothetical protein
MLVPLVMGGTPIGSLPILPSVARVKVTSYSGAVAVIEEVNLPRGEWKGEALHFYIAFGAPGPKAIDAHLVPVNDGALEPDDDEVGEVLPPERVPRRPASAFPLLGRESMAGIVVHVPAASLTRALARANMAALRIRSLVDATESERSVVVRLGSSRGVPLTLGRIAASAGSGAPSLAVVEARLCGPEADPRPLAVSVAPKLPPASHASDAPIAPVLAVRHASDDLCIRVVHAAR